MKTFGIVPLKRIELFKDDLSTFLNPEYFLGSFDILATPCLMDYNHQVDTLSRKRAFYCSLCSGWGLYSKYSPLSNSSDPSLPSHWSKARIWNQSKSQCFNPGLSEGFWRGSSSRQTLHQHQSRHISLKLLLTKNVAIPLAWSMELIGSCWETTGLNRERWKLSTKTFTAALWCSESHQCGFKCRI